MTSKLLASTIPVILFTDHKKLFNSIINEKKTTEKQFVFDISGAREPYKRIENRSNWAAEKVW